MVFNFKKGLVVEDERDGDFLFTINDDNEVLMNSYEMAKFMYLLRSYLYDRGIDKKVTPVITLKTTYDLDGELYEVSIWLNKDDDIITISVLYVKEELNKDKKVQYDINTEPDLTIDISLDEAKDLISEYIELEYQKVLELNN